MYVEDNSYFTHPLKGNFEVGQKVTDITAEENGWSDVNGEVIEVDGSHVKIKYESGRERWKKHINLRLQAGEWEGSCICDDPEPTSPTRGHKNSAGGYCCPHYGNTCGYHPEYR